MNTRSIMLVEDNPDEESLTQRGLSKASREESVAIARNGVEAIALLEEMVPLPCLILLDLKLPKLDGTEVLRQIRGKEHTRHLCVVIFTSSSEPSDIARCYSLGCNSYVIKPVTYEDYISSVERIAGYWLDINTPPTLPG